MLRPSRGDVVVVQLSGFGAFLIRLGALLKGHPFHANHVAIVTGDDEVIEAWPGVFVGVSCLPIWYEVDCFERG